MIWEPEFIARNRAAVERRIAQLGPLPRREVRDE